MEQKSLEMFDRKELGKGASRRLRAEGKIPAIVYGKDEPLSIAIDAAEFAREFKHVSENTIISLGSGKKSRDVLIKDYQFDLIKDKMIHLDFYEVEKGKSLTTHVPVKLVGNPVGIKEGGVLEEYLNELEVECLPKDLPEIIEVDISALDVGDSIHVEEVKAPKGVTIHGSEGQMLVAVHHPTPTAAEAEEGEGEEVADAAETAAAEGDGAAE